MTLDDYSNEWKNRVIKALIINFIYQAEHETNPKKALDDLIASLTQLFL